MRIYSTTEGGESKKTYNTTRMRADHDTGLGGHEKNSQDLLNTAGSTRVDLANINGIELEQLLEVHLVLSVMLIRSKSWVD